MKALLLSVGDEVLCGKVINTNASFLAIELEKIGIETTKVVTIGDDRDDLIKEVQSFLRSDVDILITTGGLGPTHDDFTKEVLFETIGLDLVFRQEPLDLLNEYFHNNFSKCNMKQTYYPKDAYLIPNKKGTAMGAISEKDGKIYAILVGPPFENKPMIKDHLIPYLSKKINVSKLIKEYIVMGIGESKVEELLQDYYQKYPNVEINPYCSIGKVRYQITASKDYRSEFEDACSQFVKILDEYIITSTNEEIEEKVYQELVRLNKKITFAESCTGGMLATKLINVSGASSIIDESYITYAENSKINILGVKKKTIDEYDIVSKEVAYEMAKGAKEKANAFVGVGVTGYAGPTGGSDKKSVGTVCFCIYTSEKSESFEVRFTTERNILREKVTMLILYHVYRFLKSIN